MKLKTLVSLSTLCCLLSVPATAQQDPGDQGAADSAFVEIIQPVAAGQLGQVAVNLYFFNDVQNVGSASMGFSWDNPSLVMDSAIWSPEAMSAFNGFRIVLFRDNLDSTNFYRRFQFVGLRFFGDGLAASNAPKLITTYFFHSTDPAGNDSLCIKLEDFNSFSYVDLSNVEYSPIWRGDVCAFQPRPNDTLINLRQWPVSQGGNGHWYAVVPQRLGWFVADSISGRLVHEGIQGHLATITSEIENQFVAEHILPGSIPDSIIMMHPLFWLGAIAFDNWHWVTGEPWVYTNWVGGWPPNHLPHLPGPDSALALAMIGYSFCETPPVYGKWTASNPHCDFVTSNCKWAVVEFDTEEQALINLKQWPVSEGGNGHWYAVFPNDLSWPMADSLVRMINKDGVPGHLATVTSAPENEFIVNHILPRDMMPPSIFEGELWLGGYMTIAGWHWVTGEPFSYHNWADTIPGGYPDYAALAMIGHPPAWVVDPSIVGQWVSRLPECGYGGYYCKWSIVEFDIDAPPGGRVRHVPAEYPTIMGAISASRDGDAVVVAPGTYHEAINFLGKNIEVRSSHGPQETIITNDRTTDLVTFNQGETHQAVLEGFTLQGGWMAVLCVGSGPTIRHNICVEQNVWNWSAIGLAGNIIIVNDPSGDPRYSAIIGPAPAIIENNTIVHSANGGISMFSSVPPTIRNNIVAFNAHYGIHQQSLTSQPQPIIDHNDVYRNDTDPGGNAHGDYINIPDPGEGAISTDPLFTLGFGLMPNSPCIDAGHPDPRYNDPDGTRGDMGAVPFLEGPGDVIPTNEWISVYCDHATLDGVLIPSRAMIAAFDPDGVMCGLVPMKQIGSYGFMPIYRDDPYTNIDEGAEPGDLITFRISGEEVSTSPTVYWTENGAVFEICEFLTESCRQIALHEGWNLISWNVAFESEIYDALVSISDCLDVVQSFEQGGLVFDPNLDRFNTLTWVDYHHGYWFRMHCDAVLEICGEPIPQVHWINLEEGWNLVSYWPDYVYHVEDGFGSILPYLQQAMGFDDGAQVWVPDMPQFNTLRVLQPLSGYWTKVDRWLPLLYPGFFPMDCTSADGYTRYREPSTTSPSVLETARTWMSVYGENITLDGNALTDGAVLEFYAGEDALCGRAVYTDNMVKFTPVYGHDESSEVSKLYPKQGEAVTLFVDGQRAYPGLQWEGNGARVRLDRLSTDSRGLPQTFVLEQNYPNPFNPGTSIAFGVPIDGRVTLSVYNVLGQKVRTVTDQHYTAGRYEVEWNGDDDDGHRVATGIYFYRMTAGDVVETKKMLLLK